MAEGKGKTQVAVKPAAANNKTQLLDLALDLNRNPRDKHDLLCDSFCRAAFCLKYPDF